MNSNVKKEYATIFQNRLGGSDSPINITAGKTPPTHINARLFSKSIIII